MITVRNAVQLEGVGKMPKLLRGKIEMITNKGLFKFSLVQPLIFVSPIVCSF